jgi:hypothetical protein
MSPEKLLAQQDEQRRKARLTATPEQFSRSFISEYADQIEAIRRGAIVTDTGDLMLPNGKPVPTVKQARRTIWWSRKTRPIRRFWRWLKGLRRKYDILS